LSVIRGIGELGLGETRTPAVYKEAMGSMLEEVDRLTRLVDTLLQLSRGDAGTIRLSPEVFDLGDLARGVASSLGLLADERQQRLDVMTARDVRVSADRFVLRDAVTNLVDNAIKYSPSGSTIRIHVDGGPERATLSVADEGGGIAAEHRERIFDRFYRIDEGRAREMGGTGLGLAIAKWAVEANGGQITLEPTSKGSVFRISLPRLGAQNSA
jgi:signal transduction histidine kinase